MSAAAHAEPILRVEGLSAGYEGRVLLRDVSFEVHRGEILVLLGGSGSGKSTLLKHMIGLYAPIAGRVLFEGRDLVAAEGVQRLAILQRFGVMYQQGALFGSMTLLENVRLPLEAYTQLRDDVIDLVARTKLDLVRLLGFDDYLPAELSGGMRKRAAIARAMALDPDVLFLDEPSAGLDPVTSAELDQLILRLRDLGVTFVVVTHELPSVFTIADRAIMLDKEARGIVAQGDPRALQAHSDNDWVRRFFNREPADARTDSVQTSGRATRRRAADPWR
jgi:phospholipid/cholesterol/gamma-HCH transport system ATP-binding protein